MCPSSRPLVAGLLAALPCACGAPPPVPLGGPPAALLGRPALLEALRHFLAEPEAPPAPALRWHP